MDDRAIARWRMAVLRLTGDGFPTAQSAVERLLAVQSENFAQAAWAVAARTPGLGQDEFEQLFNDGAVLRTHVLRSTWHFVAPDDIRWLLELTAPRSEEHTSELRHKRRNLVCRLLLEKNQPLIPTQYIMY